MVEYPAMHKESEIPAFGGVETFPRTPKSLLRKISELAAGKDDSAWARFVEIYAPALRNFVLMTSPAISDADAADVVQETFVRLVDVLREGEYDPARARFRTYLATIMRRLVIDLYRRRAVRREERLTAENSAGLRGQTPDPAALIDAKWRLSCRKAAEESVLEHSALAPKSKELWRMVSERGMSVKDAAKALGIPANTASKTKRRVEAMIAAVEAEFME